MPESVFIETTIPSYLTSRPSRDLIIAAHQQLTHEWWRIAGRDLEMVVSEAVLDEIRAGDAEAAARAAEPAAALPARAMAPAARFAAPMAAPPPQVANPFAP